MYKRHTDVENVTAIGWLISVGPRISMTDYISFSLLKSSEESQNSSENLKTWFINENLIDHLTKIGPGSYNLTSEVVNIDYSFEIWNPCRAEFIRNLKEIYISTHCSFLFPTMDSHRTIALLRVLCCSKSWWQNPCC